MEFFKKYAYVILGMVCLLALGGLYMAGRSRPSGIIDTGTPIVAPREAMAQEQIDTPMELAAYTPSPTEPTMIGVHIAGEVYSPGFHIVPYGSRVNDVVELAGGLTQYADLLRINLAAFVDDAAQIIIPTIGEDLPETAISTQPGQGTGSATTADGRININLASLDELQTLPSIGPTRAQNIINHRESVGSFNTIEEVLNVSGIGPAIFESIRDSIAVN